MIVFFKEDTAPLTRNKHVLCAISNYQHLFEKIIYVLSKELEIGIEILADQVVFKLRINTVRILFWSITHEPLGLLTIFIPINAQGA